MKGVIMAGGFGTRLKPLTIQRPKPMVPVANRPIMEHIVDLLRGHGIDDLVSILYFQPEHITRHFGDGSAFGVRMRYATAEADFGTAGAVRNAWEELRGERIIIISGDVLTDFDLGAALAEHEARGAEATICLTSVDNPLAFGIVIVDQETGRIQRFLEKPTWGEVFSDTINTGIYILEPEALERVPPKTNFDFSKDLFPAMLREGAKLYGHVAEGYWRDIGNIEEYRRAHKDILRGKVKVSLAGTRGMMDGATVWREASATFGEEIQLAGTVIVGADVQLGNGVTLENVVIGPGCLIGDGVELRETVIWEDGQIGPYARISESICAQGVRIGEGAMIRENCVLSDRTDIGDYAVVGPNVKVWPDKTVDERAVLTHSLIWGDAWARSLFHGARVSGVANSELTPEIAARLGGAFGAQIGPGGYVVTSRDSDRASRMVNRALMTGLMSAGVNVEDLRQMAIPVVRHAVHYGREAGGLHVRRSPFDPKIIDILFYDADGRDLPPSKTQSIERLFAREDFPRAAPDETGDLNFPARIVEGYREHFLAEVDEALLRSRRFSLVVDYAYGATTEVFPAILGQLQSETISLDAYPSPGRHSRSASEFNEGLSRLGGIVRSIRADLGLWIDPGGEVIRLVDEGGRPLAPEMAQLALVELAMDHLGVRRVAIPVTSPAAVAEIIQERGGELIWTKTEHHSMMAAVGQPDLVAGSRGEVIFPRFIPAYDGMYAAVKVLEALARSDARLGELTAKHPPLHIVQSRIACPWGRRGAVMRHLLEATDDLERQLVDGVKVWISKREWVLIIPHANRPHFVITAEGPDVTTAQSHLERYAGLVQKWRDEA